MVREIKNKPLSKVVKGFFSSPLFFPYLILFFVMITIPVVYLVSSYPLEIRQRAATIASGSIVVNTDETSFQSAAQQIIPASTFNMILGTLVLIAIFAGLLGIVLYKRR
jgi:hypothetical protein